LHFSIVLFINLFLDNDIPIIQENGEIDQQTEKESRQRQTIMPPIDIDSMINYNHKDEEVEYDHIDKEATDQTIDEPNSNIELIEAQEQINSLREHLNQTNGNTRFYYKSKF
jgi:hypothetical protein